MKVKFLMAGIAWSAMLLAGCSSVSTEDALKTRVQSMAETAELGTVEYTVKKIVKCNDKQKFTMGDRKILFSSTAYLKAGIDLKGFSSDDVVVEGKKVTVTLPHAQLLSFDMPADETKTVFENYGFFRSKFSAAEQNEILTLGENEIRADVPNLGILQDAEQNARDIFTAMLSQMGFETVNIKFKEAVL